MNNKQYTIIAFNKKPLSKKELLKDNDIVNEHNGFEDLDENEMLEYLSERYGMATLALLYGYSSPKKLKKLNKKNFKNTKKKHKSSKDKYLFDEDDMYQDSLMNEKTIYYYRDVNNPDDCEIFNNVHEFESFLDEEGIEVSDIEVSHIMTREISHCCINPYDRFIKNRLRIMTSSSYGDLRWSYSECEYDSLD